MAKSKKQSTQNVENIGGQVSQAGGNVPVNAKPPRTVVKKIALWVGIVASVVGIVVGVLTIITAIVKFTPESARLLGKVRDRNGQGVESATVYVLNKVHGDTIGVGQTDWRGEFNFPVKSKRESTVYILIEKDGKTQPHGFETLAGNKQLTLK